MEFNLLLNKRFCYVCKFVFSFIIMDLKGIFCRQLEGLRLILRLIRNFCIVCTLYRMITWRFGFIVVWGIFKLGGNFSSNLKG
jgi:hypothetical protein